jgi:hypothetical protein
VISKFKLFTLGVNIHEKINFKNYRELNANCMNAAENGNGNPQVNLNPSVVAPNPGVVAPDPGIVAPNPGIVAPDPNYVLSYLQPQFQIRSIRIQDLLNNKSQLEVYALERDRAVRHRNRILQAIKDEAKTQPIN